LGLKIKEGMKNWSSSPKVSMPILIQQTQQQWTVHRPTPSEESACQYQRNNLGGFALQENAQQIPSRSDGQARGRDSTDDPFAPGVYKSINTLLEVFLIQSDNWAVVRQYPCTSTRLWVRVGCGTEDGSCNGRDLGQWDTC
jgi:hypothetical protein